MPPDKEGILLIATAPELVLIALTWNRLNYAEPLCCGMSPEAGRSLAADAQVVSNCLERQGRDRPISTLVPVPPCLERRHRPGQWPHLARCALT